MTRNWRWPDLRNGAGTLHQITDTHTGAGSAIGDKGTAFLPWILAWLDRARDDIEALKITTPGGHVHTGDMIDNWWHVIDPGAFEDKIEAQYVLYTTWRDAIITADGLPFAQAIGNHEAMGGIRDDGSRIGTTGAEWATFVGLDSVNNTWDMGQFRVITLGPDEWMFGPDGTDDDTIEALKFWRLPNATLDWLDAQLTADTRPTILAAHVALIAQYPDAGPPNGADAANPRLRDIIGAHTNVIGWLSGHRHNSINTDDNPAAVITVAGRELFAICAPGGGGGYEAGGGAYSKGQWDSSMFSTYMTLLDENNLDIRWRDHLSRRWVQEDPTDARILLTRT